MIRNHVGLGAASGMGRVLGKVKTGILFTNGMSSRVTMVEISQVFATSLDI